MAPPQLTHHAAQRNISPNPSWGRTDEPGPQMAVHRPECPPLHPWWRVTALLFPRGRALCRGCDLGDGAPDPSRSRHTGEHPHRRSVGSGRWPSPVARSTPRPQQMSSTNARQGLRPRQLAP